MSIFKDKNFKDEKYTDKDGYVMVRMPEHEKPLFHPMYGARGYGFEHRVNMAKKLGRPLTIQETVHHIDKDRRNNHPDNLEVHLRRYHHLHHRDKGDYKLFSKDYQPRWKKEAMDSKVKKMLFMLGGATAGNIPAYLTYQKSKKVDNPEKAKGMKRKALEQAAFGTLIGGYGGHVVSKIPWGHKSQEKQYSKAIKEDKILEPKESILEKLDKITKKRALKTSIGAGVGGSYGLYNLYKAKKIKDEDERQKAVSKAQKQIGLGTVFGGTIGAFNSSL